MDEGNDDINQAYAYFVNIFQSILDEDLLNEIWFNNIPSDITPTIADSKPIESKDTPNSVHDLVNISVLQAIELLDNSSSSSNNQLESHYCSHNNDNLTKKKKEKKNRSNKNSKQVYKLSELDSLDLSTRRLSAKELLSLSQLQEIFIHDRSRYPERMLLDAMRSFDFDLDKATNYLLSYEPCYISAVLHQTADQVMPTSNSIICPDQASQIVVPSTEIQTISDSTDFITVERVSRTEHSRCSVDASFQKKLLAHFSSTFTKNNPGAMVSSSQNRLTFLGLRRDRPKQSNGGNVFFNGGEYHHTNPLIDECDVLIDLHGLNVQVALDIVDSSLSYYYASFEEILKVDARLPEHNADLNSVFQHLRLGRHNKGGRGIVIRFVVGRGLHSPQGNGKLSGCVVQALQISWQGVEYQRHEGIVDVYLRK